MAHSPAAGRWSTRFAGGLNPLLLPGEVPSLAAPIPYRHHVQNSTACRAHRSDLGRMSAPALCRPLRSQPSAAEMLVGSVAAPPLFRREIAAGRRPSDASVAAHLDGLRPRPQVCARIRQCAQCVNIVASSCAQLAQRAASVEFGGTPAASRLCNSSCCLSAPALPVRKGPATRTSFPLQSIVPRRPACKAVTVISPLDLVAHETRYAVPGGIRRCTGRRWQPKSTLNSVFKSRTNPEPAAASRCRRASAEDHLTGFALRPFKRDATTMFEPRQRRFSIPRMRC